jgi:hypothetical protein
MDRLREASVRGPQAVLAYLPRYTHRVAIANGRLISCDRSGVTFRWKDYRAEGRDRQKVMTLATAEFIRRFLIHVLPHGFHRIRHKVSTGHRPSNNHRHHRYTAPPCGNCGGSLLGPGRRRCAGDCVRMVRSAETKDSDPPSPRYRSLPPLKGVHSSCHGAALKPANPRGLPKEVREPPGAVREECAGLREEPTRRQEQPTAATGPQAEETGLAWGAHAAPSPHWIGARSSH